MQAADRFVYKGMMLSGTPNFVFIFGYTNASWPLKIGLVGEHLGRLLRYMDAHGYDSVTPVADASMPMAPFSNFGSGYIQRALDQLPRQGNRAPWRISPTYSADVKLLRRGRVDDPELRFDRVREDRPLVIRRSQGTGVGWVIRGLPALETATSGRLPLRYG